MNVQREAAGSFPEWEHWQTIRREAAAIWQMCWPIVVTMLVTSLNDTVNAKAAAMLGAHFQTAVTVVDQINFNLVLFLMALGIGVNAILARAKGANDVKQCKFILQNALQLSLVVGALLASLSALISPYLVNLLVQDPQIRSIAVSYTIFGAMHLLPYAVICMLTASMRSLGDAKTPMYGVVLSGLLTCSLSLLIVLVPELRNFFGVAGIGLASALGAASGSWVIIRHLRRTEYGTNLRLLGLAPVAFARQVFAIGVPAGLQRLSWSLALTMQLAVVAIAHLPDTATTAMTVGLRIMSFAYLPSWAASFGVAVLVGNALGEGDRHKAFTIGWVTTALATAITLMLATALYLSADSLARLMSNDAATVAELGRYLQITALSLPLLGLVNPLTGAMQGAGETRFAMWSTVFSCWVVRIPLALVLAMLTPLGALGIWLSINVSVALNCVLITWKYQRRSWLDTKI
jgi:putative MATE family efflux protein